ncbi:MAG: histidine phosphatase family protein [Janthinobacterium lividum]
MATHTTWIAHALTTAMREARFALPADTPDPAGLRHASSRDGASPDRAWCSPAACARDTAAALGLDAAPEPALRDADAGAWAGREAAAIAAEDPDALSAWLRDPDAAPPGGESARAVLARVGAWMDGLGDGRFVVVTHAAVVRAAIVHALGAPPGCGLRIDLAPLSRTVLSRNGPWRLQSAGAR